jgi:hypothetical protein
MAVLEGGRYFGCELTFPKYRTAVDMCTGGLCLADVHEWHGNARFSVTDFGGFPLYRDWLLLCFVENLVKSRLGFRSVQALHDALRGVPALRSVGDGS